MFSCEFCKISKNSFSTEHIRTTASASILQLVFSKVLVVNVKYKMLHCLRSFLTVILLKNSQLWVLVKQSLLDGGKNGVNDEQLAKSVNCDRIINYTKVKFSIKKFLQ